MGYSAVILAQSGRRLDSPLSLVGCQRLLVGCVDAAGRSYAASLAIRSLPGEKRKSEPATEMT